MDLDTKMFTSKFAAAMKSVESSTAAKGKGGISGMDAALGARSPFNAAKLAAFSTNVKKVEMNMHKLAAGSREQVKLLNARLTARKKVTAELIKTLSFEKKAAVIRKRLAQDDLIADNKVFKNRLNKATATIAKIKRAHESATNQRVAREYRAAKKIADNTIRELRRAGKFRRSLLAFLQGKGGKGGKDSISSALFGALASGASSAATGASALASSMLTLSGSLAAVGTTAAVVTAATLAIAATATLAAAAVVTLGIASLKAFETLRQQEIKIDGLAKTLGLISGQYASTVKAFARKQADLTLFDEAAILRGAALLAGLYDNINKRQQQGIIKAALDLSELTGTDLFENIRSLGKAFEDPLAGFDNLRERGFAFDKSMKAQVKSIVDVADEIKKVEGETQRYKDKLGEASEVVLTMSSRFEGLAEGAIGTVLSKLTQTKQIAMSTAGEFGRMVDELLKLQGSDGFFENINKELKEARTEFELLALGLKNFREEEGINPNGINLDKPILDSTLLEVFLSKGGDLLRKINDASLPEPREDILARGRKQRMKEGLDEFIKAGHIEFNEKIEAATLEYKKQVAVKKALLKLTEAEAKILTERERKAAAVRKLPTSVELSTGKFKEVVIDKGFQASIESLVGLSNRITAAAASSPEHKQLEEIKRLVDLTGQNQRMLSAINETAKRHIAVAEELAKEEIEAVGGSTAVLQQ